MTSMPPEGRRSIRSIWPVMMTGGAPSSASSVSSKSSSSWRASLRLLTSPCQKLSSRFATFRWYPSSATLSGKLLGAQRDRNSRSRSSRVRRRVPARDPLATVLGERLERLVGDGPERHGRDGLLARGHPVDVGERVLERALVVLAERREAVLPGQRRDLEEVRAGAVVERDGPEGQRIEPLGARLVGCGGG